MSKRKWHGKMIHLLIILAMTTTMLIGSALPSFAFTAVIVDVDKDTPGPDLLVEGSADPPFDVDVRVQVDNAVGDIEYDFTWLYRQNQGDIPLPLNPTNYPLLFTDDIDRTDIITTDDDITETWVFDVPGFYTVEVTVEDEATGPVTIPAEVRVLGIIPEDIAFDVKGGQQKICVKGLWGTNPDGYNIEWDLVSGVELEPADVVVKVPPDAKGSGAPGDPTDPSTWDKTGWLEEYGPDDLTGQELVQGYPCIHIEALARGDIHIYATISDDPLGGP
jgi:hypothetical protein